MKQEKAIQYLIEVKAEDDSKTLEKYASLVLQLTNLKSNKMGILDVKTIYDTNKISFIAEHDSDMMVADKEVNVIYKDEIELVTISYDDLSEKDQEQISQLDETATYFVKTDIEG